MTKKFISLMIAFMLLCAGVNAQIYYEDVKERDITEGIKHTYMERLSDNGWQKINIITANLEDKNVSVVPLWDNKGISYKQTLSALTKESGAVAAINADFFDTTTPAGRTTPLGLTVKDGEIVSSAAHDDGLATLVEGEDGFEIGYFKTKLFLCADNGNKAQILHINKYHSTQSMVLFTRAFGERTPENTDGSIEMVVEDDAVLEIVSRKEGSPIPKNGYVIKVNPAVNNFFNENFKEGDKAEIEIEILPDDIDIKNAISGGTVLVENGKRAEFTHNVQGANPRSAAGISKDGSTLYLVTVEGREISTPGMTQKELADFMISIGAYSAINFDGGGSAEITAREEYGNNIEIVNTPSGGGERAISTAVGIKHTGDNAHFESMVLTSSKDYVAIGDYVEIWATPYDNYKNPINVGDGLTLYADDGGRIEGNKYYPVKSGVRKITATLEGVSGEIEINVLKEIASLSLYPSYLPEGGGYLSLVASDSEGFKSQISPECIGWRVEKGKGSVKDGKVSAERGAVVSATFGDKIITITVGEEKKFGVLDKFNREIDKADFVILPKLLSEDTLLNKVINERINITAKKEKNAFAIGGSKDAEDIAKFKKKSISNTLILTYRNDLQVSDASESISAFLQLENAGEDNICIYLSGGMNFPEESSKAMFDKTVKKLYNLKKNVFVIVPGEENEVYLDEGVRYITIKKLPEISLDNFEETVSEAVYLKFKIKDDKLFYSEERLFSQR